MEEPVYHGASVSSLRASPVPGHDLLRTLARI